MNAREHYEAMAREAAGPADGWPAFPLSNKQNWCNEGMTLRDYFAAHAPTPANPMQLDDHCAYRYRYADAMLRARAGGAA